MMEQLEDRRLLATFQWAGVGRQFGQEVVINQDAGLGIASLVAADIDGDRDPDVVSASYFDGKIVWYENVQRDGTAFLTHLVTTQAEGVSSVAVADLDRDGDLDLVSASQSDDTVAWYENRFGDGSVFDRHEITVSADGVSAVSVADMDGDGDPDVVFASEYDDVIAWYENRLGNASRFEAHTISTGSGGAHWLATADVDGDGRVDVLTASWTSDTLAWYKNPAASGAVFVEHTIAAADASGTFRAADLDGDGDVDVVSAAGWWFENAAGNGLAFSRHAIDAATHPVDSVDVADLDRDGDLDILTSEGSWQGGTINWYENEGGSEATFVPQIAATPQNGPEVIATADLDGDGDLDILAGQYMASDNYQRPNLAGEVVWYASSPGHGSDWTTFASHTITATADGARTLVAADLDQDGDMDILAGGSVTDWSIPEVRDEISWYENTTGDGSAFIRHMISQQTYGVASVYAADVDGDGDLDVLSASETDGAVAWFENLTGRGTTFTRHDIVKEFYGARSLHVGDMDGDRDLDIVAAGSYQDTIAWFENLGRGSSFAMHAIVTSSSHANAAYAADIDRDGDLDVVAGCEGAMFWYENTTGRGSAFVEHSISDVGEGPGSGVASVKAADLDGDGDLDVVYASEYSAYAAELAWYENTSGDGSAFAGHPISWIDAEAASSVDIGDIDEDGDLDLVCAWPEYDVVAWYENHSDAYADTLFREHEITNGADGARAVYLADIDRDGHPDVLSASENDHTITWYLNTHRDGLAFTEREVASPPYSPEFLCTGDLDGDGDLDVLIGSLGEFAAVAPAYELAWYENTATDGSAFTKHVIAHQWAALGSVALADLDSDGDLDVVVGDATWAKGKVSWYQNTSGDGSAFTAQSLLMEDYSGAQPRVLVYPDDFDGDGDFDVLCWVGHASYGGSWSWLKNVGGDGPVFASTQVSTEGMGYPADIDGDGDQDLLVYRTNATQGLRREGSIVWLENRIASEGKLLERSVGQGVGDSMGGGDLDGDGDLDILTAGWFQRSDGIRVNEVAWFENVTGNGGGFTKHVLAAPDDAPRDVRAADLNADGDLDVLCALEHRNQIVWYENVIGDGSDFTVETITTSAPSQVVLAADIDGDGGSDVLSAQPGNDVVAWFKNPGGKHAAVGNLVWSDRNGNGLQDGSEPGLAGIRVRLLDAEGRVLGIAMTAGDGRYRIDTQYTGVAHIEFTPPGDFVFSPMHAGANVRDAVDSDADPATGTTGAVHLAAGVVLMSIDAGLRTPSPWQNRANPLDVDGGSGVTPNDVLMVINFINAHGSGPLSLLPATVAGPPPYVDVNGDDAVSPQDVLTVINYINAHSSGSADGEGAQPARSAALAAGALAPCINDVVPFAHLPRLTGKHDAGALTSVARLSTAAAFVRFPFGEAPWLSIVDRSLCLTW